MPARQPSRRTFLKASCVAAAGAPLFAPRVVRAGALDKLNIGVIGVQGQGWYNIGQVRHENIVALCDVDAQRLATSAAEFPGAATYRDYRVMLEKQRDLDAVVVATPDHSHAPAAMMAMGLGLHCYCEKPLAHSVAETRAMSERAAERGLATQMGTQIHAGANYRRVVELIRGGAIGPVREAHVWCGKSWSNGRYGAQSPPPEHLDWDLWLGAAPARPYSPGIHPGNWRRFWDYGTGTLGDMACHYMDLVHWALDLRGPVRVTSLGPAPHDVGTPGSMIVRYEHAARGARPAVNVTWYDGGNRPSILAAMRGADGKPVGWGDGQLFVGDKGYLLSNYGQHRLLPDEDFAGYEAPAPTIPDSIGHHREWIAACKTGSPTTCNFDYSGALTETVLLGNVAFRTGKSLEWDASALRATNAPEADVFVRPPMRAGWELR